jgi:hypothetical protein
MLGGNFESTSQIVAERHAVLGADLGQAEESIAAIAPGVAAGSGTHLAAGDLAADVILRTVDVQRYFRPLETISSSVLLACSRFGNRSSVTKPVRRRKMRSNLARSTKRCLLLGLVR